MRKIDLNREEQAQAIDLTPMLDVVFILLIFFIVTAAFIKAPGIDVDRTKTITAEASKPGILVAISQNDEIWIDFALPQTALQPAIGDSIGCRSRSLK